jgi:hypothetical protein
MTSPPAEVRAVSPSTYPIAGPFKTTRPRTLDGGRVAGQDGAGLAARDEAKRGEDLSRMVLNRPWTSDLTRDNID